MLRHLSIICLCTLVFSTPTANAVPVQISVERVVFGANRPALSPMWFGFHDGDFDYFDAGQVASDAIKAIAELGDSVPLRNQFGISGLNVIAGTAPLTPESPSAELTVDIDSRRQRFLSLAAMVLPSNDTFYGNDNPRRYELFDSQGSFIPQEIVLTKTDWWDAGSELNDRSLSGGAAYIRGADPTDGIDSRGTITPFAELSFYNGAVLPNGERFETLPQATDEFEPMVRITIVPEPSHVILLCGMLLIPMRIRQRR